MIKSRFVEIIDTDYLKGIPLGHRIFTSLEGENPGGSIKDHMVKSQLELWLKEKIISPGDWTSELSSGSTALSLAYYAKALKLNCAIFLPKTTPLQTRQALIKLNVKTQLLDMATAYADYNAEAKTRGYFQFNQLFDANKKVHYHKLGEQFKNFHPPVNVVIGATGTGHSLLGIADGISKGCSKRPWLVSAEPGGSIKIQGCRNLELERYGEQDPLTAAHINQRLILSDLNELWPFQIVQTDQGPLQINLSFQLVLGLLRPLLRHRRHLHVFAVGSANCLPSSQLAFKFAV